MGAELSKRKQICWHCCKADCTHQCSSCHRFFHNDCLERAQQAGMEHPWICSVCKTLNASPTSSTPKQTADESALKALPILISVVLQSKSFERFEDTLKSADSSDVIDALIAALNLAKADDNGNVPAYSSMDAFLVEIKWIRKHYRTAFADAAANEEVTKQLRYEVNAHLNYLNECADCYTNAHTNGNDENTNFLTAVCDEPHNIVWIQRGDASDYYWPAKVMSVRKSDGKLLVRFFGDHTHEFVPALKCFLFTENSRYDAIAGDPDSPYYHALCESDTYAINVEKKFGQFHYAEKTAPINTMQLAEYAAHMISGSSENKVTKRKHDAIEHDDDDNNNNNENNHVEAESDRSTVSMNFDDSSDSSNDQSKDTVICSGQSPKKPRLSNDAGHTNQCKPSPNAEKNDEPTEMYSFQNENEREHNNNVIGMPDQMIDKWSESMFDMKIQLQNLSNQCVAFAEKLGRLEEEKKQIKAAIENQRRIDRAEFMNWVKGMKICLECNATRPQDMLYFCDAKCHMRYLEQLKN